MDGVHVDVSKDSKWHTASSIYTSARFTLPSYTLELAQIARTYITGSHIQKYMNVWLHMCAIIIAYTYPASPAQLDSPATSCWSAEKLAQAQVGRDLLGKVFADTPDACMHRCMHMCTCAAEQQSIHASHLCVDGRKRFTWHTEQ
jgi:hypothetical protein